MNSTKAVQIIMNALSALSATAGAARAKEGTMVTVLRPNMDKSFFIINPSPLLY
jgi:hypothetical protein